MGMCGFLVCSCNAVAWWTAHSCLQQLMKKMYLAACMAVRVLVCIRGCSSALPAQGCSCCCTCVT